MGAESSMQQDGKSQEDVTASLSAGDLSAEVRVIQEGGGVLDEKPLQKNGQISSMTSLNGHTEDNTLSGVGQPDGVSVAQKEETSETVEAIQDEVAPQLNGEKVEKMEKESPDANDISAVEEKAAEEKPDDTNEVGFKKMFRFVGFKFTLKKDRGDEKEPVKLVLVKDKEGDEVIASDEPTKEEEAVTVEEKSTAEEKETEAPPTEAEVKEADNVETTEVPADGTADAKADGKADDKADGTAAETTEEAPKPEEAKKEVEASPPPQEPTISPFRKLFTVGHFFNLRKRASIRKTKEEEEKEKEKEKEEKEKEAATEEEAAAKPEESVSEEKEEKSEAEKETKEEAPASPEEEKPEPKEEAPTSPEEPKAEAAPEQKPETPAATTPEEAKPEGEKAEPSPEAEEAPAEVTSESELLSSQEKAKLQGSPLKKLLTGAGLKKLSTKKQKGKKDADAKLTESGEHAAELQSSTESTEAPKADSGPSSPEESGEHALEVEATQAESSQETDGEVTSDGEKKKDGIIPWSSFKKLVTPKKRVKRSSDSEDEATGEKPVKSATLSSSESAPLADKSVEEEAKEEKPVEEEPNAENAEKLVSSTEEPKKKMDTSVSWEALMCMGGPKKRTRKTSDSDDEDTKVQEDSPTAAEGEAAEANEDPAPAAETAEEVAAEAAEEEAKTEPQEAPKPEEEVTPAPEPVIAPPERISTWNTLKRMVLSKNKPKVEEKTDDGEQADTEAFSLRKFFPGRRKKKVEQKPAVEAAEEDSDTPAVVPLSEYDDQPAEPEKEQSAESAQSKASPDDRSPSWIPAMIEDDDQHDQLSDIPEEAENVATPKSVDTDNTEDDIDEPIVPPPKLRGRRLSTAEVKPLAPAPPAQTTPVPHVPTSESAVEVVAGIEAHVSETPYSTAVALEDVPIERATEETEFEPQPENAETKKNTILEPHSHCEAMAICTGLGTKEIAKVSVEKPASPIIECVAVVRDALSTSVLTEEKPLNMEEATAIEEPIDRAETHQIEIVELEPAIQDQKAKIPDYEAASEGYEPEVEKVGVITTVVECEVIQPTTMTENSPKTVIVNPITPTSESAICTQSVEVSEQTVETKEIKMDTEQLAATEENTPVTVVTQVVTNEMSSVICDAPKEADSCAGVSREEVCVITETVVLVNTHNVESSQVASTDAAVVENATVSEPLQVQKTSVEGAASDVQQAANHIEAQSMAIAESVVKGAVDKVSQPEPKMSPTKTSINPDTAQAVATTEQEIEVSPEALVVTDTPVPVLCEKPLKQPLCAAMEVIDTIQIEVTESLDPSSDDKKPKESLKKAMEVKVCDDPVIVEEVKEINDQAGKELETVQEEASKEDEAAQEEVKAIKDKVQEVHMPVQVVLQTAQVVEDFSVQEEALSEFDSNGPVTPAAPTKVASQPTGLSTLQEEPQMTEASSSQASEAAGQQEAPSRKCAQVMAQVIEVIEEAVKEIEPVSSEVTTTS